MSWASQVVLMVKNPPANAGDVRDTGSIPESGKSPGRGHGIPCQYFCPESPMERGCSQDGYSPWGSKQTQLK